MNKITNTKGEEYCLDCEKAKIWQQGCIIWEDKKYIKHEIKVYKPFGYILRLLWLKPKPEIFGFVYTEQILPLHIL